MAVEEMSNDKYFEGSPNYLRLTMNDDNVNLRKVKDSSPLKE